MLVERAHRILDVKEFSSAGLPHNLGEVAIKCPHPEQRILRMAIRADGGIFLVPGAIAWIYPMLIQAQIHQRTIGVDHPFCYVTVRHGLVNTQTDDEWHVDGFSTKVPHVPEQNYIWADRDGTEYADLKINVPGDFNPLVHNINKFLQLHIGPESVSKCQESVLYCMDPYIVHRRPLSATGQMRTFVRISFVPIEINDINNTQNPMLLRQYDGDGVAFRNTLVDYPG